MNGKSFMKHHCLKKKNFIETCNLSMEDITDADYLDAKRVCKGFEKEFR